MNRKSRLLLAALSVIALPVSTAWAQASATDRIPPEVQEFANKLLQSPEAQFLSGSGLSALNLMSGRVLIPQAVQTGMPVNVLPFQSARFEVLVNDPNADPFAAFDISTQSETAVAAFGNNVVVSYNDSADFFSSFSFMGYSRSTDGGASFTDLGALPPPVGGFNFGDPGLVVDRAGNFFASAIGAFPAPPPIFFDSAVAVSKSTDGGQTWGAAVQANFVPGEFQDKMFIAVDETGGSFNGNVYVSSTSFGPLPGLPILFSRSTNGGVTFSPPIQISPFGHSNQGSEPVVGPNGEVYVAWFRFFPLPSGIVIAKSTDGGASFGTPVFVAPVSPVGFFSGNLFGNFRSNSFPRIDVNPVNGHVYIVFPANPPGPDAADVFFTRSTDGGATWSAPSRVNDDATSTDQFFPDIAVNRQGVIEVVWYDRRRDPAHNLRMDIFKAQSRNGGLSFRPNKAVTLVSSLPAVGYDPIVNRIYMGDYIDIKAGTSSGGRRSNFLLSWGDFRRIVTTLGGTRPDQDVFFARD